MQLTEVFEGKYDVYVFFIFVYIDRHPLLISLDAPVKLAWISQARTTYR